MPPQRQSPERMYEELDTVFARYNELVVAEPEMVVALLLNTADSLRDKFNVEVEAKELDDGKYVVYTDDGVAGFLGFERDDDGAIVRSDMPKQMDAEPLPEETGQDGDDD